MGNYEPAQKAYDKLLEISPPNTKSIQNLNAKFLELKQNALTINGLKVFSSDKYSFSYPAAWFLKNNSGKIMLLNPTLNFWVTANYSTLPKNTASDQYIKSLHDSYGNLIKDEPIQQPNSDSAYGRVWQNGSLLRMQLFIFKGNAVIELNAWPASSIEMNNFYQILSSLRFS